MVVGLVVVLEPGIQLPEDRDGVGAGVAANVVTLERLDERLGHSVGLRTANRGEPRRKPERQGEVDRLGGRIATAIVREVLDAMRRAIPAETLFDGGEHHITDDFAADAGGRPAPSNRFAIAGVEGKGDANDFFIPAEDLEAVRAPAGVRAECLNDAVVSAFNMVASESLQQDALPLHDAVDAFVIDAGLPGLAELAIEPRSNTSIAERRLLIDDFADQRHQVGVGRFGVLPTFGAFGRKALDEIRARDLEGIGDRLHGVSSGGSDGNCDISFFS